MGKVVLDSPSFYGWVVVSASFFVMMTYGVFFSYSVFVMPLINEFGWSRAATSAALSIYYLMHSICGIFMGWLYDRCGPRVSVGLGAFLVGVSLSLCSQVTVIWHLYLFFAVAGIGASVFFTSVISTVMKWFVNKKGLAVGIASSGIGVASLVIPLVAGHLIAVYNWRTAFVVLGVSFLIIDAVAATVMKRNPETITNIKSRLPISSSNRLAGLTPKEVVKSSSFWVLYIIFTCFSFTISMLSAHLVPFAINAGISPMNAAEALGLIGLSSIVGRIALGTVSDRIGRARLLFISGTIQVIMMFWIMKTTSMWMLYTFSLVFGLSYGGYLMIGPIVGEFFGLAHVGANLAVLDTSWGFGGMIGPILGGYLFDVTGSYHLAFLLCVISSAIVAFFSLLAKQPKNHKGLTR